MSRDCINLWAGPSLPRAAAMLSVCLLGAGALAAPPASASPEGAGASDPAQPAIVVHTGHTDAVTSAAFSPDSRLLATASRDNTVQLWDVASGCQVRALQGHGGIVKSVSFLPQAGFFTDPAGKLYWKGQQGGGPCLAQVLGNSVFRVPDDLPPERAGNLLPGPLKPAGAGRFLLSADWQSHVCLWDGLTGRMLSRRAVNYVGSMNLLGLETMAVSPDGRWTVVAISDELKIWGVDGEGGGRIQAHDDSITSLAFSPDSRLVASGSWDKTVKLWRVEGGRLQALRTLEGHSAWVQAVAFSPDGRQVASAGQDGSARVWDVETGRAAAIVAPDAFGVKIRPEPLWSVAFHPRLNLLAVGSDGGDIVLYDLAAGKVRRKLLGVPYPRVIEPYKRGTGHLFQVNCLAFSPDGRWLASGGADATVRLWDVACGQEVHLLSGFTRGPTTVAFSPDGQFLAEGGGDEGVRLWNARAGCLVQTLPAAKRVQSLAFSRDGRLLGSAGGEVAVWDMPGGRPLWRQAMMLVGEGGSLSFNADATLLAGRVSSTLGGRQGIAVWDARTGKVVHSIEDRSTMPQGLCVSFTPDGRRLLTVASQTSSPETSPAAETDLAPGRLFGPSPGGRTRRTSPSRPPSASLTEWDTATWKSLRTLPVPEPGARRLLFDGGSRVLIVGHSVHCVDLAEWRVLEKGSPGRYPATVSLDGQTLVTSDENTIHVLRRTPLPAAASRPRVGKPGLPRLAELSDLALDPQGRRLALADPSSGVHLYDLQEGQVQATLLARADGQWVAFLPDRYYRCAPKGPGALGIVAGLRAFPVDLYDLMFNRPDLVMERLDCGDPGAIECARQAYRRRLDRMNLREDQLRFSTELPHIEVEAPGLAASTAAEEIALKVTAADPRCLLERLVVWVNEVPVAPAPPAQPSLFMLRPDQTQRATREFTLALSQGTNKIQIAVLNQEGLSSLKETLYVERVGGPRKADLWLVAVGVSRYREPSHNLELAAKDARDIERFFHNQSGADGGTGRFGRVHVLSLLDEKATRENILASREFLALSRVDDVAMVFAAGHGLVDAAGEYYFASHDVVFTNPARGGLAFNELHLLLGGIPARNRLLLLDTCHTGEAEAAAVPQAAQSRPATAPATGPARPTIRVRSAGQWRGIGGLRPTTAPALRRTGAALDLFADLRRETGAAVIGASASNEFSCEGPQWRNGVFTYAVLECLASFRGDADGDGSIRVSELSRYVASRVDELTGGRQNPTERRQNPANDFPLAELSCRTLEVGPVGQMRVFTFCGALAPDGRHIATGHLKEARVWDLATGQSVHQLGGHGAAVMRINYVGGQRLLTQAGSGEMKLWELPSGRQLGEYRPASASTRPAGPAAGPGAATGPAGGRRPPIFSWPWPAGVAAAIWPDRGVLVWNDGEGNGVVAAARPIQAPRLHEALGSAVVVAADGDGGGVLTAVGNVATLWDLAADLPLRTFSAEYAIEWLALNLRAKRALAVGRDRMSLWDTESGKVVAECSTPPGRLHPVFSADGRSAAISNRGKDPTLLLDTIAGRCSNLPLAGEEAACKAFSPDGRLLLTGGRSGILRLWNAQTGELVRLLSGHRDMILYAAFGPDGRSCVSVSTENTVKVWPLPAGLP